MTERKPLGAPCKYCGSEETYIEMRLRANPIGGWSLAGVQMKTTASYWPYAVCDGCNHVSEGKYE